LAALAVHLSGDDGYYVGYLDHLLAIPIYDASRCSIGFHPLHQPWFIALYITLCFLPKTRLVGVGLMIHMVLDSIDCQVTNAIWIN